MTRLTQIVVLSMLISGLAIRTSSGAKILLFPFQIRSHIISLNAIGAELVQEGHEVYSVVHSEIAPEFHQLQSSGIQPVVYRMPPDMVTIDSDAFQMRWIGEIIKGKTQRFYDSLAFQANTQCDLIELDEGFKAKLEGMQFDLALVDGYDFALCNYLFISLLKIPYVTVTSFPTSVFTSLPNLPSFAPSVFMQETDEMNFRERLTSFFHFFFPSWTNEMLPEKYFNNTLFSKYADHLDDSIRSYYDFPKKSMLTFVARGHALESPISYFPDTHPLEAHTAHDVYDLTPGFQALYNSSRSGIVIVSFGSLVSHIPDDALQTLINVFAQRKETFIIKYSKASSTINLKVPENVHLLKWLPQNSLLGHPGTQLFISHAGNLGQYEALYHGVPMLNMPMFADQAHNAFRAQHRGLGLTLHWKSLKEQQLAETLEQLLDDPSFKERTRQAARVLRGQPLDARQTAAYWINHVLQFGNQHLKSSSWKLTWYQYWMLDILLLLSTLSATVVLSFIALMVWLVGPLRKPRPVDSEKDKDL